MSLTFGFYNSRNGDRRYNAEQMSAMFDGVISDGIFQTIGDKLMVSAESGMTVNVGTGRAWFNHTWTYNDSVLPITIDASEIALNRIDTVVIDVDKLNRTNSILVIKGTPASKAVAPTLIRDSDSEHYQYPLCDIKVQKGVTAITQSDITNRIGTDTPFAIVDVRESTTVKLLWKNAVPNSAFAAQDIKFNRSIKYGEVYDAIYIRCRFDINLGYEQTVFLTGSLGGICEFPPTHFWGVRSEYVYTRPFIWKDDSIEVGDCCYIYKLPMDESLPIPVNNKNVIPIAIYGIKWSKFINTV